LLLGEFGIDSLREGEARQKDILSWQIESAFRAGLAGAILFSFTDDWYRGEHQVLDWQFGLTTRERQPKEAFGAVQRMFKTAPYFPLSRYPMVSVVVACYNGGRTLKACLDSLQKLNYPSYEVILVDDGSTDQTPQIAAQYPKIRYIGLRENRGLSVARNTGIEASQGEVIAFTDADCRADKDWLFYLVGDLIKGRFAGIGGHNFLPPEDSWVAAAVMVSPGGPAHVMLTDRLAEHIPGCNMAFYKWALDEIGGFDPVFRKAGDDVDVCWRLQQRGLKIGFSPAGFVWHYRRSTVRDYLAQQAGYGEAEALLVRKHPEYFNALGGSLWTGRIYSTAKMGIVVQPPMIYRGAFASSFFQSLYAGPPVGMLTFFTSLEYYVLLTMPLLVLSAAFGLFTHLAVTTLLFPLMVCVVAAIQAQLPKKKKRFWSRPLVGLLFFLQPLVRGAARYRGRLTLRSTPLAASKRIELLDAKYQGRRFDYVNYWAAQWVNRIDFVTRTLQQLDTQGWQNKTDSGWDNFDIEIAGNRWSRLQLTTVSETYDDGKQMFRCRLRTAWSLPAHIVFWSTVAAQLLLVGALARTLPWLWLLLLTLPAIAWVIRQQQRDLQRMIALLLDEVAEQMGLTRVLPAASPKPDRKHPSLSPALTL
jgi:glycosyltransferase involved in cell wall biosynthesis